MAENSAIEWTDGTFNPWWGCRKVSPACDHCYAERDARRYAPGKTLWGSPVRRFFTENHWNEPRRWNKRAARELAAKGRRMRVFCASMGDVFDNEAPDSERAKLWRLIEETPHIVWQLLTKRIGNARRMLPEHWIRQPRDNVALGSSIVTQPEAARDIPRLLATPARWHFLSLEPLLEHVDLAPYLAEQCSAGSVPEPGGGGSMCPHCQGTRHRGGCRPLSWVIVGGESGPLSRPLNPAWVRCIRDQCAANGTAFFFKQWGEWAPAEAVPEVAWSPVHTYDSGAYMMRVGKKIAGRTLDGVTWSNFPEGM